VTLSSETMAKLISEAISEAIDILEERSEET
jgi:hypothetical protein